MDSGGWRGGGAVRTGCEHVFVSRRDLTPTQKGNIAEAAVTLAAAKLGVGVLKPVHEGLRYDLIFDFHPELARVQCKWAPRRGSVVAVKTDSCRTTARGYVRSPYTAAEIDAVAAYCPDLDRCYYLPIAVVSTAKRLLHLRLSPALNNQRLGVHWAAEYAFPGAVAQLGERHTGSVEATGSSPVSSIGPARFA